MLAAGHWPREAPLLAGFMDRMARPQLIRAAAGGVEAVASEEAIRARDFLRGDRILKISFDAWVRRVERRRANLTGRG